MTFAVSSNLLTAIFTSLSPIYRHGNQGTARQQRCPRSLKTLVQVLGLNKYPRTKGRAGDHNRTKLQSFMRKHNVRLSVSISIFLCHSEVPWVSQLPFPSRAAIQPCLLGKGLQAELQKGNFLSGITNYRTNTQT